MKRVVVCILCFVLICFMAGCNQSKELTNIEKADPGSIKKETSGNVKSKTKAKRVELEVPIVESLYYQDGMIRFKYKGKYGYMNDLGKVTIDAKYRDCTPFSSGYALAEKETKKFYTIDKKGNETPVSIPETANLDHLSITSLAMDEGVFVITADRKDEDDYVIDGTGKIVFTYKGSLDSFSDGVAMVFTEEGDNVQGYTSRCYDKNGNILIPDLKIFQNPKGVNIGGFNEGLFTYSNKEGMYGAINTKGETVIPFEYEKLSYAGNNRVGFLKYAKWGYLDYQGNEVIKPSYPAENTRDVSRTSFCGGAAIVPSSSGGYQAIDPNGKVIFSDIREIAKRFDKNGLALIQIQDGTNIFINAKGGEIDGIEVRNDPEVAGTMGIGYAYQDCHFFLVPNGTSSPREYYRIS